MRVRYVRHSTEAPNTLPTSMTYDTTLPSLMPGARHTPRPTMRSTQHVPSISTDSIRPRSPTTPVPCLYLLVTMFNEWSTMYGHAYGNDRPFDALPIVRSSGHSMPLRPTAIHGQRHAAPHSHFIVCDDTSQTSLVIDFID